jgi:hypothetical protein
MPLPQRRPRQPNDSTLKQRKVSLSNSLPSQNADGRVEADSGINRTAKIQTKQPSTSTPMPNLSQRITAASKDSINSMRRIAIAQKKVADALLDGLGRDEPDGPEAQRPCKNVTPPKTNQPRR